MTNKLDAARIWARKAHNGQVDKLGVDYMKHVEAVADAVVPLGEETVIVALLHDVVEDCADPEFCDFAQITKRFGLTVGSAVEAMTKRVGEDYSAYLTRVRTNPIAKAVKIADIAHNTSRIRAISAKFSRLSSSRRRLACVSLCAVSATRMAATWPCAATILSAPGMTEKARSSGS